MTARSWEEINTILIKMHNGKFKDSFLQTLGRYHVMDVMIAYNGLIRTGAIK